MASHLPVYLSFGIARHFIFGTDTSFMKLYILAEGLRAEIQLPPMNQIPLMAFKNFPQ